MSPRIGYSLGTAVALWAFWGHICDPATLQSRFGETKRHGRGALVRLDPASAPEIVRIIAVPSDRLIVYRHEVLVGPPGSAGLHPVDGLSPPLLRSPEFQKQVMEPVRQPYVMVEGEYFVMGEGQGKYFIERIPAARIVEHLHDDGRVPNLPLLLHQFLK